MLFFVTSTDHVILTVSCVHEFFDHMHETTNNQSKLQISKMYEHNSGNRCHPCIALHHFSAVEKVIVTRSMQHLSDVLVHVRTQSCSITTIQYICTDIVH